MTDISELREGDQIDATIRMRMDGDGYFTDSAGGVYHSEYLSEVKAVIARPEIIPGKPYLDVDGLLFIGLTKGRVMQVTESGNFNWFGGEGRYREGNPLPAGLRPARVVAE